MRHNTAEVTSVKDALVAEFGNIQESDYACVPPQTAFVEIIEPLQTCAMYGKELDRRHCIPAGKYCIAQLHNIQQMSWLWLEPLNWITEKRNPVYACVGFRGFVVDWRMVRQCHGEKV